MLFFSKIADFDTNCWLPNTHVDILNSDAYTKAVLGSNSILVPLEKLNPLVLDTCTAPYLNSLNPLLSWSLSSSNV